MFNLLKRIRARIAPAAVPPQYFVVVHLPGSPDDSVWTELDRRMEERGYSSRNTCPYWVLPRGVYLSYDVDLETEEGAVFTYEEAEAIALDCWPTTPIVFAFGTTDYFGTWEAENVPWEEFLHSSA
jgi:hypothetical protein